MRLLLVAFFSLFLFGCATKNEMAIDQSTKVIDLKEKSIVLLRIKTTNEYKPDSKLNNYSFHVEQNERDGKAGKQYFVVNNQLNKDGYEFISMALVPGKHELSKVLTTVNRVLIRGMGFMPLNFEIDVKPNTVSYLGNLSSKIRERVGEEFRAGAVIPLVDQAVSGYSGGTWDVVNTDQFDQDIALFREAFPVLKQVDIKNQYVGPWDRAKAQTWWEKN